jgi:hypothetical protein
VGELAEKSQAAVPGRALIRLLARCPILANYFWCAATVVSLVPPRFLPQHESQWGWAAGNESTSAPVYPAALNNYVVGIASTTNWDSRSTFSNYGSVDVLIAAPGENIVSTFPGGTYASASGTSFSSPLVAGSVALMLSARPSLNQNQAANALSHAIQLTPDLNHGRLDVYQAVSAWVNSSGSSSGSGNCWLLCN